MAASAADIRSALSIPEASASAGPSLTKKQVPVNTRKPEGISRELYSLIGPSAPSLSAQLAKPRLKQKPNFGGRGGKTNWSVRSKIWCPDILTFPYIRELRSFINPGRQDHLELKHWEKVTSDPPPGAFCTKVTALATEITFIQSTPSPSTTSNPQPTHIRKMNIPVFWKVRSF